MTGTARTAEVAGVTLAFVGAVAMGLYAVRPFVVGPIGPDAAAPVIEFQRLLAGQQLEGYLSQTSKPLLTVLYGLARIGSGDWRSVSLLAIVSFGAFVAAASLLAYRIAGLLAAAFAGVALALSPELLRDVTFAYGVSWAMLAGAVAGLAVVRPQPRYGIAGIALAAGALARPEVLAVTGFGLAAVVIAAIGGAAGRWKARAPRTWLIGLGLLAIPILSVHDFLLTGDPLRWANIAQENSAGGVTRGLLGMLGFVARYVLHLAPLLPLAGIALISLAMRRRWTEAIVVAIVPIAVATFFIASGSRGTVISNRYLMPINLGIVFAAAVGLGAFDVPVVRRVFRPLSGRGGWGIAGAVVALGASVAVALAPSWPFAPGIRASVAAQRTREGNAERAFAALSTSIGSVPAWRGVAPPADPETVVYIPAALRAQGIVDLDLPLWAGTKLFASMVDPANGLPAPGSILYHDSWADRPAPVWRQVELTEPAIAGRLLLTPILADGRAGIWIVRVEAAPGTDPPAPQP